MNQGKIEDRKSAKNERERDREIGKRPSHHKRVVDASKHTSDQATQENNSLSNSMRGQQEDIEAKRFLDEEDLDDSNLALKMRRRDNARDKSERHVQEHEKREIQDASKRLRENTLKPKDEQDTMIY